MPEAVSRHFRYRSYRIICFAPAGAGCHPTFCPAYIVSHFPIHRKFLLFCSVKWHGNMLQCLCPAMQGDELFGGYGRYFFASKVNRTLSPFPAALRRMFAAGITGLSPQMWNTILSPVRPLLSGKMASANLGHKLHGVRNHRAPFTGGVIPITA